MKYVLYILTSICFNNIIGQTDSIIKILNSSATDSVKISKSVEFIDKNVKSITEKIKLLNYLEINSPEKDTIKTKAYFLFQKGQAYFEHSNYIEAIALLYKALPLAEQINYIWLQGKIYNYLGIIFSNQGDNKKAVACFIKTYDIAVKTKDFNQQFVSTNNVAVDLTAIGEYKKAIYYLNKAEKIILNSKTPYKNEYLLSIHGNKLEAYIYLDDKDNINNEMDSIEFRYSLERTPSNNMKITYNQFKAEHYMYFKNYTQAVNCLNIIEPLIAKDEFSELIKISNKLFICYENLKQYEKANNALKNYFAYKDSIASTTVLRQTNEFEENYNNLKIENELKIAKLTNANNALKLKRNQLIFTLGTIFIVTLFLAFLIVIKLYRNNKHKKLLLEKQKNLIEEKQSEILSSIRYAKRIQESLLPSQKYISKKIKN